MLWLYERTGDQKLLDLADLLHQQGHDWVGPFSRFQFTKTVTREQFGTGEKAGLSDVALSTYGVNNGQAAKTGPVWYRIFKNPKDYAAASEMKRELDRFHGLPNGMFSCDEHLAGRDPSHGSELCTVVGTCFPLSRHSRSPAMPSSIPARRVSGWVAMDGVAEPLPMSPVKSELPLQTIELIPYAAAKLRITAFPRLENPLA